MEPVVYKQGQNIVFGNERITADQLELLRSLGLLDDENFDLVLYIGGVLIVLLAMAVLAAVIWLFGKEYFINPMKLTIMMIVLIISFAICIGGKMINIAAPPVLLGCDGHHQPAGYGLRLCRKHRVVHTGQFSAFGRRFHLLHRNHQPDPSGAYQRVYRDPDDQAQTQPSADSHCGCCSRGNQYADHTICQPDDQYLDSKTASTAVCGALLARSSRLFCALGWIWSLKLCFSWQRQANCLELSNPNHPLLRRLLAGSTGHLSPFHHRCQPRRKRGRGHRCQSAVSPCRCIFSRYRQDETADLFQGKPVGRRSAPDDQSLCFVGYPDRAYNRRSWRWHKVTVSPMRFRTSSWNTTAIRR